MARVLLVEDDPMFRAALIRALSDARHTVRTAATALSALREIAQEPPEVVILDLGLPDLDGSDVLRMIRGVSDVPVVIATARDDEAEIVRLLNAGADDYLVKPFSSAHLAARLTAVLRRTRDDRCAGPIVIGTLSVDPQRREATLDGKPVELTRKEFDLLRFLAERRGTVVSRREMLAEVWRQPYGEDQTIDVHLSWLRRKLGESAANPRYLRTVRGVGVKLVDPDG